MFKNALVSVSDKTGLVDFLRPYVDQGLRVVSTGGTAKYLRKHGFKVVDVQEQTQFPEVMDGRVKTLHPFIHMALLFRPHKESDLQLLKQYQLEPFDLVIGNLYPFEETLKNLGSDFITEELIEQIDIGGPSLLRAAAKNFRQIIVICSPSDYKWVQNKKELTLEDRRWLASKVFAHTAAYDSLIAQTLNNKLGESQWNLSGDMVKSLRYGENPQQEAYWYHWKGEVHGLHQAQVLQGKELSFNNLLDIEAAVSTLREFNGKKSCVAVKHNNPCGVGVADSLVAAVERALKADPVSVFGGVVACSHEVDEQEALLCSNLFLECLVAPSFSEKALSVFSSKKNLRLLAWKDLFIGDKRPDVRRVSGGFLVQTKDQVSVQWDNSWKLIGELPSERIKADLLFAWKVCAHLKSNAISIAESGQTLGLGMGQTNRVDAVKEAIERMKQFHQPKEPVLASDAFFPFPDSIELAADAGIRWVIQPGGSIRDQEVIQKARERGVNLILTGKRHFLH
ncbi:MAG: bifunctional phosphoribosylaminoimidazolecarboxamide formyltransferase/IMP cyclohydrolase PurH [Bdellovibrio sp.]|nr:MAG: bifunctional phosphoribosylaminoimidazolecarboxamide formyltransferase/IMP cyclohydrolase PurH [Bdellovibrio sp.]